MKNSIKVIPIEQILSMAVYSAGDERVRERAGAGIVCQRDAARLHVCHTASA